MKRKNKHLFKYLFATYTELDGAIKGLEYYEYGFFRAANKKAAVQRGREIWTRRKSKRKWILISNEKGKEVLNYSQ